MKRYATIICIRSEKMINRDGMINDRCEKKRQKELLIKRYC